MACRGDGGVGRIDESPCGIRNILLEGGLDFDEVVVVVESAVVFSGIVESEESDRLIGCVAAVKVGEGVGFHLGGSEREVEERRFLSEVSIGGVAPKDIVQAIGGNDEERVAHRG